MANAIEKLFDSVIPGLRPMQAADWPETETDIQDPNPFEDFRGSDNDSVLPLEDEARVLDVLDRMGERDAVTQEDRELIEGGIRARGMDVLAFYKSRRLIGHRPFIGRWGIFYLQPGLAYVRDEIAAAYPGFSQPSQLALEFLREHEHFHFRADVQTLMFEATLGHHLYMPLRKAMRGRSADFVEEALANRQVWDWAKKATVGMREFAYDFMKLQPGAYARFDERRLDLAAEWAAIAVDLKPAGLGMRRDLAAWVEATPRDYMRRSLCPEYVVRPVSLSRWISPVFQTPPVLIIVDGEAVQKSLGGRHSGLKEPWEETKRKLQTNRHLRGLDFKPWRQDGRGAYSVRVDDKFRAHLRHEREGQWTAYAIGGHKEMGHG
ncbi:MAG TPA: hypothetical protein PLA97_03645 [Rubrivivax sp.]|nr:hypothetical protein [Rubrivivax sp.]